jgi:hypothetical protein
MRIDPTQFATDHPLSVALRKVSRHWHLAYSKLLSLEWEWDDRFPYGATDGKVLLLNRKGIDQLVGMPHGVDYITFLLLHESLHALLGHGWRLAQLKNPQLANVAADYVINAMIQMRNRELKREVFRIIPGALLDEKLSGDKSVEQLYRELLQPEPPQPEPQPQDSNDQQDQDDSEEGSGQEGDQDLSDPDDGGDGDEAEGDGGDSDADPSGDGDESGSGGGSDEGSGDGDVEDTGATAGGATTGGQDTDLNPTSGSGEPDLKDFPGTGAVDTKAPDVGEDESLKEVIDRMEEDNDRLLAQDTIDRQTMAETGSLGQRVARDRGSNYTMPWATLLHEWLRHNAKAKWNSPFNPAVYSGSKLVAAGRHSRAAGTIVWVLDTSGSIGQATYDRFLGEGQVALDDLKPEAMHILSVSHQVCDAVSLETGDAVPDKLAGGGGTKFQPAFDWVAEHDIDPDVLVYLTDGEATDIATLKVPDYPVVWLSTRAPSGHYPFGEVIMVTGL